MELLAAFHVVGGTPGTAAQVIDAILEALGAITFAIIVAVCCAIATPYWLVGLICYRLGLVK